MESDPFDGFNADLDVEFACVLYRVLGGIRKRLGMIKP